MNLNLNLVFSKSLTLNLKITIKMNKSNRVQEKAKSKEIFRSLSQAVTCPPVYHTRWRLLILSFLLQIKSCRGALAANFYSFWFDPTGNRIASTVELGL